MYYKVKFIKEDLVTNREREVYEIIRENPLISQEEIAKKLGIKRSSVGVHILNLTQKGCIRGRGYVLDESPYVVVIGGTNIDLVGMPNGELKGKDSNPGIVKMSFGGVGRNIGENLARLGVSTKLMSAIGSDGYGKKILNHARQINMDMGSTLVRSENQTSVYMAVLNEMGDMSVAISDMDVMTFLDEAHIEKHSKLIEGAQLVVLDANLSETTLAYIFGRFSNANFFVDPVSIAKAEKLKPFLGRIHTIKPNVLEAQVLSGMLIKTEEDGRKAVEKLMEEGICQVFISLGEQGVMGASGGEFFRWPVAKAKPVNTTGAGDAYMAGLVFSHMEGYTLEKTLAFSSCASILTMESMETICPRMSAFAVNQLVDTLYGHYKEIEEGKRNV